MFICQTFKKRLWLLSIKKRILKCNLDKTDVFKKSATWSIITHFYSETFGKMDSVKWMLQQ